MFPFASDPPSGRLEEAEEEEDHLTFDGAGRLHENLDHVALSWYDPWVEGNLGLGARHFGSARKAFVEVEKRRADAHLIPAQRIHREDAESTIACQAR